MTQNQIKLQELAEARRSHQEEERINALNADTNRLNAQANIAKLFDMKLLGATIPFGSLAYSKMFGDPLNTGSGAATPLRESNVLNTGKSEEILQRNVDKSKEFRSNLGRLPFQRKEGGLLNEQV